MKKFLMSAFMMFAVVIAFAACGKKNTAVVTPLVQTDPMAETRQMSAEIENTSTELIYSIEYMDDVNFDDLSRVNNPAAASATTANAKVATQDSTSENTTENKKAKTLKKRRRGRKSSLKNMRASAAIIQTENNNNQSRMRGVNPRTNSINTTSEVNTASEANNDVNQTESSASRKSRSFDITSNTLGDANEYSDELVEKRAKVMLLCSKLRRGDINVSPENLAIVNECLSHLKSTTEHLNGNRGAYKEELNSATTKATDTESNLKKIALREKLAVRQAKLQTSLLVLDQMIDILEGNATETKDTTSSNTAATSKIAASTNNQTMSNQTNQTNSAISNRNTISTQPSTLVGTTNQTAINNQSAQSQQNAQNNVNVFPNTNRTQVRNVNNRTQNTNRQVRVDMNNPSTNNSNPNTITRVGNSDAPTFVAKDVKNINVTVDGTTTPVNQNTSSLNTSASNNNNNLSNVIASFMPRSAPNVRPMPEMVSNDAFQIGTRA